jgi:phage-related minor tail protein
MKIKLLSLKRKCCILFSIFFIPLFLVTVPYTYCDNSSQHGNVTENKTEKRIDVIYDEFLSKCDDLSINIKEVKKAYQEHMKDLEKYNKSNILYEKKYFKNIKKDYYKYISKEEQKELERVAKNYILALKTEGKVFKEASNVTYKLAKANRSKSPKAKSEMEKVIKNIDIVGKKLSVMLTKLSVAIDEYNKVYDDIITKNMKEILRKKSNKNNINKQIISKNS